YTALALKLPVEIGVPLVTDPIPLSMDPVPPEKTAVSVVLVPEVIGDLAAVKLVMVGAATTSTVSVFVALAPAALVAVNVYTALALKLPVEIGVPLVTDPIPLSMDPVPPEKTAVRVVLVPEVIGDLAAVNL